MLGIVMDQGPIFPSLGHYLPLLLRTNYQDSIWRLRMKAPAYQGAASYDRHRSPPRTKRESFILAALLSTVPYMSCYRLVLSSDDTRGILDP